MSARVDLTAQQCSVNLSVIFGTQMFQSNIGFVPQCESPGIDTDNVYPTDPFALQAEEVAKPKHYSGVSPYDVGRSMYGPEGLQIYVLINAVKYIKRYPFKYKGDSDKQLEDLVKARESLDTAIDLHKSIHGGTVRNG